MGRYEDIYTGIDIGTRSVKCIIARRMEDDGFEVIGMGSAPNEGAPHGSIVNIANTTESVRMAVNEAQTMGVVEVDRASVSISGSALMGFNSDGNLNVHGKLIDSTHVDQVTDAASAIPEFKDRELIHILAQEYLVDRRMTRTPIGSTGIRLESYIHAISAEQSSFDKLIQCMEKCEIEIEHFVGSHYASSLVAVTQEQKESGVVVVDIGGGTTDVVVYVKGVMVQSFSLDIGGDHFTNDLALVLSLPATRAVRIKESMQQLHTEAVRKNEEGYQFEVRADLGGVQKIDYMMVKQILKERGMELFEILRDQIPEHYRNDLGAGFVLTGGGAELFHLDQWCTQATGKTARKAGFSKHFSYVDSIKSLSYCTCIGLILYYFQHDDLVPRVYAKRSHGLRDLWYRFTEFLSAAF